MGMKHPSETNEDEPPAKKIRTEESLMPEIPFLAKNKVIIEYVHSYTLTFHHQSYIYLK